MRVGRRLPARPAVGKQRVRGEVRVLRGLYWRLQLMHLPRLTYGDTSQLRSGLAFVAWLRTGFFAARTSSCSARQRKSDYIAIRTNLIRSIVNCLVRIGLYGSARGRAEAK